MSVSNVAVKNANPEPQTNYRSFVENVKGREMEIFISERKYAAGMADLLIPEGFRAVTLDEMIEAWRKDDIFRLHLGHYRMMLWTGTESVDLEGLHGIREDFKLEGMEYGEWRWLDPWAKALCRRGTGKVAVIAIEYDNHSPVLLITADTLRDPGLKCHVAYTRITDAETKEDSTVPQIALRNDEALLDALDKLATF